MTTALRSRIRNLRNDDGFTLLELAVGILIAGILAAIGYPLVLGNEASGNDDAVRATITHYMPVMAEYRVDHGITATPSIHATAFKAVQHPDGTHFAVVSDGAAYCVLGYAEGGQRTKEDPIAITEGNLSGNAQCPIAYDPATLDWN